MDWEEMRLVVSAVAEDLEKQVQIFEVQSTVIRAKVVVAQEKSSGVSVSLARGPGSIGVGQIQGIQGNVDIYIPVGGTAADALLFVADYTANEVKVFDVNSGNLVRSITGNGKGSGTGQFNNPCDVCIANTGPQNASELFVSNCSNHVVMVLNPMTGDYIRSVGTGQGSGPGQLSCPRGLFVQTPLVSGGDFLLYVTDYNNHRVQVFNAVTGVPVQCIGAGQGAGQGQLNSPLGGVVLSSVEDGRGGGSTVEVLVPDYGNNRISVYSSVTGAFVRHMCVGEVSYPFGLALSLGGLCGQGFEKLLYVSECNGGQKVVQIWNMRTGMQVGNVGVGVLKQPCGLKLYEGLDGKSLLFVSDVGNKRVEVFEV
jgi:hypothetical protein